MSIEKQQNILQEEKKGFWTWVKDHKKQLLAAGVSIAIVTTVVVGIKDKDALIAIWRDLNDRLVKNANVPVIKNTIIEKKTFEVVKPACEIIKYPNQRVYDTPFNVSAHVRNLPAGRHPSAEKVAIALEHGIELEIIIPKWIQGIGKIKKCAFAV